MDHIAQYDPEGRYNTHPPHKEGEQAADKDSPDVQYSHDGHVVTINPQVGQSTPFMTQIDGANKVKTRPLMIQSDTEARPDPGERVEGIKDPSDEEELEDTPGAVTVEELDFYEKMIDHVGGLFESYYNMMPSEEQSDKEQLHKTVDILRFIGQLNALINTVTEHKDEITGDLQYLDNKLKRLSTSPEDMLKFFRKNHEYNRIKRLTNRWLEKDLKFMERFNEIAETAKQFKTEINKIATSCYDLYRLAQFFIEEIMELKNVEEVNTVGEGLKNLDRVIMLVVRLMNMRTSIRASIGTIKESFGNLKDMSAEISKSLKSTENLAVYYEVEERTNKPKLVEGDGNIALGALIGTAMLLVYK